MCMDVLKNLKEKYERKKQEKALSESDWAYQERLKKLQKERKQLELKQKYQREKEKVDRLKKRTGGDKLQQIRSGALKARAGAKKMSKSPLFSEGIFEPPKKRKKRKGDFDFGI